MEKAEPARQKVANMVELNSIYIFTPEGKSGNALLTFEVL